MILFGKQTSILTIYTLMLTVFSVLVALVNCTQHFSFEMLILATLRDLSSLVARLSDQTEDWLNS